jgi:hypothetical protein
MEKITINKSYFKLNGNSCAPPPLATPQRNKVNKNTPRDWNGKPMDYDRMSYEEYQTRKIEEIRRKKRDSEEMNKEIRILEEFNERIMRNELNEYQKGEVQKFVTNFKRRWYK